MATEMKEYVATIQFNVGLDDSTALSISKGDTVQFNGTKAIVGGDPMNLPKLRAAIRVGWLVEEGVEGGEAYQAPSANIKVRGATPQQKDKIHDGGTSLSDDEQVVSSVGDRSEFVDATNHNSREKAQTRSSDTTVFEDRVTSTTTTSTTTPKTSKYKVLSDADAEGQEAIPLNAKFKTAATNRTDISKMGTQQFSKMVKDLEEPVTPAISPKVQTEGITFNNHNVGERSAVGAGPLVESGDDLVVGKVGAGSPSKEASAPTLADLDENELDDALDLETREGRWNLAKILYPDLPEWDFKVNWRAKIDLLKDGHFDQDMFAVRAVYACESEAIKKRMKSIFDL